MAGTTTIFADWMAAETIINDVVLLGSGLFGMPIVSAPNGPYAAGSTPVYSGRIIDPFGKGVPPSQLNSLTLTIVDTLSGEIINDCDHVNILNVGRGTVDGEGNITIRLEVADTLMDEVPGAAKVQRSMIIEWTYQPAPGQQYLPLGYRQIADLSEPVPFPDLPDDAVVALVTVSGAAVRYLDNGQTPTPTAGFPIGPGVQVVFTPPLADVLFIEQTEGALLDILYYGAVPPAGTGRHQVNFTVLALAGA